MKNWATLCAAACIALLGVLTPVPAEPPTKEDDRLPPDIPERRNDRAIRAVSALTYTPDSRMLIAASLGGTVRVFDPEAIKVLKTLTTSSLEVYAIAVSPDSRLLVTAGSRPEIQIWDLARGELVKRLRGHQGCVAALAFSPDGKRLASGSYDKTIRIWDTTTWGEVLKITGDLDRVTSVAYSPDGKTLASGGCLTREWKGFINGQADLVRLWNLASGKLIRELAVQGSQVAFAPDGRSLIASGVVIRQEPIEDEPGRFGLNGYASIVWYDLDVDRIILDTTRKGIGSILSHSTDWQWFASTTGALKTLHFDGNVINSDRANAWSVGVYELPTREMAANVPRLYEQAGDYETITAFSPDHKRIATGSFFGHIEVRSLMPGGKNPLEPAANVASVPLNALWGALADAKAEPAYGAMLQLLAVPKQAVGLLADRLKPFPAQQLARVNGWVEELSDRDAAKRQKALNELRWASWAVMPLLRQARVQAQTAEARKRLSDLLASLISEAPSADRLREMRAVAVLERIASPEAINLLKQLAGGGQGAALTEDAGATLKRLERRRGAAD